MTAPKKDSRSIIERARELARLGAYEFHDRSGEVMHVFDELLGLAEACVREEHGGLSETQRRTTRIQEPYTTIDGYPTADTAAKFPRET